MKKWDGKGGLEGLKDRRRGMAAALCLFASMLFTGCGADGASFDKFGSLSETYNDSMDYSSSDYYNAGGAIYSESMEMEMPSAGSDASGLMDARKLIETVRLDVETKEFEQMMTVLERQVRELGGYIESMNTYNGSSYSGYSSSRYASLTIRIPQDKLKGFLETVSNVGNIVRRSEEVEDVTLSYVDMESRRDTLRTEQSRLLEFLDRAETVEEIIAIEERLSNVRYQLESMESQLRTIDNMIDYSTVYLDISEVKELTQVEEPTSWERITEGFQESMEDIQEGFVEFCIWFVINIPYFVLFTVSLVAVILLLRRRRRKLLRRKEEKRQGEQNEGRKDNL